MSSRIIRANIHFRRQFAENYTNSLPIFSPTNKLANFIGASMVSKSEIIKPELVKKINDLLKKSLRVFLRSAQVSMAKESPRKLNSAENLGTLSKVIRF